MVISIFTDKNKFVSTTSIIQTREMNESTATHCRVKLSN